MADQPNSHIKELLVNYFNCLERFNFSKAGELLRIKGAVGPPWTSLLNPLFLLAAGENLYLSLNFLEPKFLRKDQINPIYNQVITELAKCVPALEAHISLTSGALQTTKAKKEASFFTDLIRDIIEFSKIRLSIAAVYRSIGGVKRNVNYDELVVPINEAVAQLGKIFTHPYLYQIKGNVQAEIMGLHKLVTAQMKMAAYQFFDSTLLIYAAKQELDGWKLKFNSLDQKMPESLKPLRMGIFNWLFAFHATLLSKMTLYFYNILKKKEIEVGSDIRQQSKLDLDYISLVENFVQKSECSHVCLVYETGGKRIDLNGFVMRRAKPVPQQLQQRKRSMSTSALANAPNNSNGGNSNTNAPQPPHILVSSGSNNALNVKLLNMLSSSPKNPAMISPSSSAYNSIGNSGMQALANNNNNTADLADEEDQDEEETLTGLKSWPAIFSYPKDTPYEHWPNLISLIQDNTEMLSKFGKDPLHYFDLIMKTTYFIANVDPRISLVLIFENKKVKKNDQLVTDFLLIITSYLRNFKIFERLVLKPSA